MNETELGRCQTVADTIKMADGLSTCFVFTLMLLLVGQPVCASLDSLDNILATLSKGVTGDTYVYVGGKIKLKCTLNSELQAKHNASQISFKFTQPLVRSSEKPREIPAGQVRVVDKSSAVVEVAPARVEDAGQYACYVNGNDLVGVGNDVQVEYAPHNVSNFQCIAHDWTDGMTCTWEHDVDYVNWDNVDVSLTYPGGHCPHLSRTSCEWRDVTEFHSPFRYDFKFVVKNRVTNDTAEERFIEYPMDHVKPSPVEALHIEPVTGKPGCIHLSWSHKKPTYDKVYRVRTKSVHDLAFKVLAGPIDVSELTSCGYLPYSLHTFAVDCFPSNPYTGYWSDPFEDSFLTPQIEPSLGPDTVNGSYVASSCEVNQRTVTLMWKSVKEEARNGPIMNTTIWADGVFMWRGPSDVHSVALTLGCGKTRIQIYAHNDAGRSRVPSVMVIPSSRQTETPQVLRDTFAVEIDGIGKLRILHAVWGKQRQMDTRPLRIFWCKLDWPTKECTGPISWETVPAGENRFKIPLSYVEPTGYMYGISIARGSGTDSEWSQVFWTSCLYDNQAFNIPAPDNLELDAEAESVIMRWSAIRCSYESRIRITHYIVKWRETHLAEKEAHKQVVDGKKSSHRIDGLKAEVPILVTVQSEAAHQLGEQTEWVKAVPLSSDDGNTKLIIGLSVGLLLIVVTATVCIFRVSKSSL